MGIYTFGTIFLALVASSVGAIDVHGNAHLSRHHEVARRASSDVHLYKRISNSKWTFYDVEVGPGACGITNQPSDFTVALNADQFGNPSTWPGPQCFKKITMRYNGKTATATIMDKCPGCPYGGLDLTRGLFSYFDSQDKGIIYGEWWFGEDGGGNAPPTTEAKPTSSYVWVPPTTSSTYVWVPPTTSSTKKRTKTSIWSSTWSSTPEPTTTSTWSELATTSTTSSSVNSSSVTESSSSSSSSAAASSSTSAAGLLPVNYSNGATSGLAVPTGTVDVTPNQPQNLNQLNKLFINLGGVVVAGGNI